MTRSRSGPRSGVHERAAESGEAFALTTAQPQPTQVATRKPYAGALLRYRIMAFATGVVLLLGTIALILKDVANVQHLEPGTGLLWLAHGYFYLVYVICTLILGVKLRWSLPRLGLTLLAGTVPTMSFVAEHYTVKRLRERERASASARSAG
jgi:integral membrane protein